MKLEEFKASINKDTPPAFSNPLLTALWHDGKGDWDMAHTIAQDIETADGSWMHAYLHRKEGDEGNALYWYQRARRKKPAVSLKEEWEELVNYFLNQSK